MLSCLARFKGDKRGQITILFALASMAIFAGLGASVDLARAYAARQKLSEVATLTCQYSTRPSVAQTSTYNYSGANGFQTYVSAVNAFATASLSSQNWGATPPTGSAGAGAGQYFSATPAAGGTTAAANSPSNPVVEIMANGQLVSTPIGGGALASQTSYTNPDGTVSTTPTVAPDGFSATSYDPTQVNPILDLCVYADAFAWMPRTVNIKITKPGYYWLFFSAQAGTADGNGGGIDDVKLTALGSPYMSSPPAAPLVAIPVPAPQPDTSFLPSTFAGFSIVADPFTPPGADQ